MYLSHHYLIDLTGGACLSVMVFYATMPTVFKDVDQIDWAYEAIPLGGPIDAREAEAEFERELTKLEEEENVEPAKKTKRNVSWGETKVLGEGV